MRARPWVLLGRSANGTVKTAGGEMENSARTWTPRPKSRGPGEVEGSIEIIIYLSNDLLTAIQTKEYALVQQKFKVYLESDSFITMVPKVVYIGP